LRLVLDPAEEAVHSEWLREAPGAYEWWYFDTLSDDTQWAITCIWFLGNPFSPYYRQAVQGKAISPFAHNALFFALYRQGQLYAYHFTRFSVSDLQLSEGLPLCLQFGPNRLWMHTDSQWSLTLSDTNANGRRLNAALTFTAPPLMIAAASVTELDSAHSWLPIAPACRVSGQIKLQEPHNTGAETITFTGSGYHDHNWGTLPFDSAIRDWYWARAEMADQRAVILYHVRPHHEQAVSHLLLFDQGQVLVHDSAAKVRLSRFALNGFGTHYATELHTEGSGLAVQFRLQTRLDSSPFYLRTLCSATLVHGGKTEPGRGIGEYLRPHMMSWPLVASAMKARIADKSTDDRTDDRTEP
jgi:carotenoid 1,2-hydratase